MSTAPPSLKKWSIASIGAALAAAFLASLCCLGPLLFAVLGIGGAGLLVKFERYLPNGGLHMNGFTRLLSALSVGTTIALCPCGSTKASAQAPADQTSPTSASMSFNVDGMTCPSCSVAVRTALKKVDGVKDAKVSVSDKRATVDYDPRKATPQQMVDAVNNLGYRASLPSKGS